MKGGAGNDRLFGGLGKDGTGAAALVQIALLAKNLKPTAADFFVIREAARRDRAGRGSPVLPSFLSFRRDDARPESGMPARAGAGRSASFEPLPS